MLELKGKVAIVTGAGRRVGIGRHAALELARLGADVVVTGTNRSPDTFPKSEIAVDWKGTESVADEIRDLGRRSLALTLDVTNNDQVEDVVASTVQEFGRIDILVNNAAFPVGKDRLPMLEVEEDVFQNVVDVKVTGLFLMSRAVVREMIRFGRGGKIVNVSSQAGKRGVPNSLAYNAASFAIVGMTQSMASELGPNKINVNAVCPGFVWTTRAGELDDPDRILNAAEWVKKTPIRRNGSPDEVGAFIASLCTEATSWITGQSINLNGGTVMEH